MTGPSQAQAADCSTTSTDSDDASLVSDSELLAAARAGSPLAWQQLIQRYTGVVRAMTRSFRLGDADAADVAQETWLRLVKNIDSIRDPERLGGWLSTTARRECLRVVRASRLGEIELSDRVEEIHDVAAGPEEVVVDADVAARLWEFVNQLPRERGNLVRALYGRSTASYAEAAATVGMPVGGVGPTRSRSLTELRRCLEQAGMSR